MADPGNLGLVAQWGTDQYTYMLTWNYCTKDMLTTFKFITIDFKK